MSEPLFYRSAGSLTSPLLVFIHGWPDDENLWEAELRHYAARYHCVSVRLPGFGASREGAPDFEEITARLHATIQSLRAPKQELTLVGHDWGAFLAYMYEHRFGRVNKMITLDVGAEVKPSSPGHALFLVSYQWYLIGAYWLGRAAPTAGTALSRAFAKMARAPNASRTRSRMNYLYQNFWGRALRGRLPLPAGYLPRCPLLFLYGEDKQYMFHSKDWEKRVNAAPGSAAHGIIGAGHWVHRDQPVLVHGIIDEWLAAASLGKKARRKVS